MVTEKTIYTPRIQVVIYSGFNIILYLGMSAVSIQSLFFCNLLSIHTNSNFKAYRRGDKMYKDTHTEKITTVHDITQRKENGNVLGNAYNPISRSTISKTHFL